MEVYPNLIKIVRGTLAVLVTGAGVEREFSKSRRVVNWTRSRLNPGTIKDVMMYKNYLARQGVELVDWDSANLQLGISKESAEEDNEVSSKWRREYRAKQLRKQ